MPQKPEVTITAKLYSIAEQLIAVGREGLQYYVNEWNKLQHEKLVELGSKLYDILNSASTAGLGDLHKTDDPEVDFLKELRIISKDLENITDAGRNDYLNPYVERHYQTTLELYSEINSILENKPLILSTDFKDVSDFTTPLIGAEAAVFRNGRLLLVQRHDDRLWAVPGGANDVGSTLTETALRELEEETGLRGKVIRLLGIFDSRLWGSKLKKQIYHVIFEVESEEEEPEKTIEAHDYGFFGKDELPHLSPGHDLRVPFLFELLHDESRIPYYD
ncbi:MAG TPA: NUDIX domain-containing protein [Dehalococcoidia bacterium]|nr:NUDIX domain-containing protein [Dehalococcoidia bacterium]